MGDIIKLKIYSGRVEVRQQDAILGEPRQRSATLRAARPYAKFADLTLLPSGLEPEIDLTGSTTISYTEIWFILTRLHHIRAKSISRETRYFVRKLPINRFFTILTIFEKSWRENQKRHAAELLRP